MKKFLPYVLGLTAFLATIGYSLQSGLGPFALGLFLYTLTAHYSRKLSPLTYTNKLVRFGFVFALLISFFSMSNFWLTGFQALSYLCAAVLFGLITGLLFI
jgi:hypothetical protein